MVTMWLLLLHGNHSHLHDDVFVKEIKEYSYVLQDSIRTGFGNDQVGHKVFTIPYTDQNKRRRKKQ